MAALDGQCPIAPLVPILANATSSHWAGGLAHYDGKGTTFGLTLLTSATVLLLVGGRLVRPVIFLCAFLTAFAVAFFGTELALSFTYATPTTSCYALMIAPVMFGLCSGSILISLFDKAFPAVGTAIGAALGYVVYALFFYNFPCGIVLVSHDLTYWLCVLGSACAFAMLMGYLEQDILIIASALLGSMLMVPAFAILVLGSFDPRFLWVLSTASLHAHLSSPFVYSQVAGALLIFFFSVRFQLQHEQSRFVEERSGYTPWKQPQSHAAVYVRP